ncbi:hypothetical protein Tco_1405882 [Tanacetum coccineum]
MAYSSSSLSEVELSSSLDSFLAFKAIDLLCLLLILKVSESFLERSDEWVMANTIEIKALKKMDASKRGKFKEIQTQQTLMQTLRDLPLTSNFDEYEKKYAQMVQPVKGTMSVAFIFEGDVMVVDDSRASMGSYIFCGDSVQQECYRLLDMAASMDTHADVTDSERSENSSSEIYQCPMITPA